MSIKKFVCFFSLLLLIMTPLFSEGNKETATTNSGKVTISFWHIGTQAELMEMWQKYADQFMASHPNVNIEITILENEAFKSKIAILMQSGNPPNLFHSWGGGVMNTYAEAGLLRDITPEVETAWGDTFAPGALKVYSYNGRYYGVPYDMGGLGFWYNKKMFAEVGYTTPPTTWSQFLDCVKKLKSAGYVPIALGEGDKWPGHYYWAYLCARIGGRSAFEKAAGRTGKFTDKPFVQAGEKLLELLELDPFQDGYLSATYSDASTLVANRMAAMELMGQWAPDVQKANAANGVGLAEDLGFFNFPAVDGGAGAVTDVMGGGNGYVVGKGAPDMTIEFLKFLTSKEVNAEMTAAGRVIPVIKGAEEALADKNMIMVQEVVAAAQYYQLYYDQYLPPAVGEAVKDAVQTIFTRTATPAEAAAMVEKAMVLDGE